jgi:hypothetical protein
MPSRVICSLCERKYPRNSKRVVKWFYGLGWICTSCKILDSTSWEAEVVYLERGRDSATEWEWTHDLYRDESGKYFVVLNLKSVYYSGPKYTEVAVPLLDLRRSYLAPLLKFARQLQLKPGDKKGVPGDFEDEEDLRAYGLL